MPAPGLLAKFAKLRRILAVPDYRAALRRGAAAGVEHARVLRQIPCRTVVDIGANRGQFALVARACFPAANIISFEPLAAPADIFARVFAGDAQTRLVRAAIGPTRGETTIHVSQRDDSSSLLPITPAQNELFPGTAEARTETITTARLAEHLDADAIAAPALLKLDVQGFELPALEGCEDRLRHFEWIYAECSFAELYQGQALADEVIAWLRDRGFRLVGVYNMSYDERGRAIQADFLFRIVGGHE